MRLHPGILYRQPLDGALDLVGTKASRTDVNMARSTVNNSFYALDVGIPGTVAPAMGVRHLDTERDALATTCTFGHSACTSFK